MYGINQKFQGCVSWSHCQKWNVRLIKRILQNKNACTFLLNMHFRGGDGVGIGWGNGGGGGVGVGQLNTGRYTEGAGIQ